MPFPKFITIVGSLFFLLACNPPETEPPKPIIVEAVSNYDKVTGYSIITSNIAGSVNSINGWIKPFVLTKNGQTTYAVQVYSRQDDRLYFTSGSAALFYAKNETTEFRNSIPNIVDLLTNDVDYTQETQTYAAHQIASTAGALGSMLSGTAQYYRKPVFYGQTHERIKYTDHSFYIPVKREMFNQIITCNEVIIRLFHTKGTIEFNISPFHKGIFSVVDSELFRRDHPEPPAPVVPTPSDKKVQ